MHPEDRDNFGALLLELSKELRPRNLELSVAVSANPEIAIKAYENHVLTAAVDWLAIAANDYHTAPSNVTTYLLNQGNGNSFVSITNGLISKTVFILEIFLVLLTVR